jgi:hypothetical protein
LRSWLDLTVNALPLPEIEALRRHLAPVQLTINELLLADVQTAPASTRSTSGLSSRAKPASSDNPAEAAAQRSTGANVPPLQPLL